MTSTAVYCEFTHRAISCDLTGRQMQLWLRLYELVHHRQNVQLNTSMLLAMLETSRSQFQRARQALIDHGFLAIRQDRQQTSYTLLLNGKEIAAAAVAEPPTTDAAPPLSEEARQALAEPLAQKREPANTVAQLPQPLTQPAAGGVACPPQTAVQTGRSFCISEEGLSCYDVIFNRQYQQELEVFYQAYPDAELHSLLTQWAEMRHKNGWSLTQWGLWTILEKLAATAHDHIATMVAMVRQSLDRRWKSFFPVKPEMRPSGQKLRQLEERQQRDQARRTRHLPQHKFKQENRDLSFLEK